MKNLLPAALYLPGLFLLPGCGTDQPPAWVAPVVAPYLSIDAPSSTKPLVIWRSDAGTLTLKDESGAAAVRRSIPQKYLVMVTLVEGNRLTSELATDPLTLAYNAPQGGHAGFALVALPDRAMLDGLAGAAHRGGFACGRLQLLTLTQTSTASTFTAARYAETVALPEVSALFDEPQATAIAASITTLEELGTREHSTETGLQATATTRDLFEAAFAGSGLTVEYEEVDHSDYYPTRQKSLIVSLPGATDDATTVILGAHLDSINVQGSDLPAPGADDNASGIATLVQIAKIIAKHKLHFDRRLEFHSYATEEKGLIGSGDIASRYRVAGRQVAAMLQMDMNSFSHVAGDQTVYLIENDTSATLRRSLKDLLNTYLDGGFSEMRLQAGTSDHRSWTNNGFNAVFPFEHATQYNHALHTEDDTSDTINNLDLSVRFAKLGLAFTAHYAGLVTAADSFADAYSSQKTELGGTLKLAVVPSDTAGAYTVGVSAPAAVKSVELCRTATKGAVDCTVERLGGDVEREAGDRTIFKSTETIELASGDRLAVFGYDGDEKLVAVRTVKVAEK
jgi:leucyl aminopeptidase